MQIAYSLGLLGGFTASLRPSAGMLIYKRSIYRGLFTLQLQRLEGNDTKTKAPFGRLKRSTFTSGKTNVVFIQNT